MATPTLQDLHRTAHSCLLSAYKIKTAAKLSGHDPIEEVTQWIDNLDHTLRANENVGAWDVTKRLNAIRHKPVRCGKFIRPNAHLICFDYAREVLDAILGVTDPDGFQRSGPPFFDSSVRIDGASVAGHWPAIANAIRSLALPDVRVIASAAEQEAAHISAEDEQVSRDGMDYRIPKRTRGTRRPHQAQSKSGRTAHSIPTTPQVEEAEPGIHGSGEKPPSNFTAGGEPCGPVVGTRAELGYAIRSIVGRKVTDSALRQHFVRVVNKTNAPIWVQRMDTSVRYLQAFFCSMKAVQDAKDAVNEYRNTKKKASRRRKQNGKRKQAKRNDN